MGTALRFAQVGDKHPDAKPRKGYGGSQVLEVVVDTDRRTYRGVYTVEFKGVVFVLHVFQKKSTQGIKTNKADLDLIDTRRQTARREYQEHHQEFEAHELQRKQLLEELRSANDQSQGKDGKGKR